MAENTHNCERYWLYVLWTKVIAHKHFAPFQAILYPGNAAPWREQSFFECLLLNKRSIIIWQFY
jgi:hypothetical protein